MHIIMDGPGTPKEMAGFLSALNQVFKTLRLHLIGQNPSHVVHKIREQVAVDALWTDFAPAFLFVENIYGNIRLNNQKEQVGIYMLPKPILMSSLGAEWARSSQTELSFFSYVKWNETLCMTSSISGFLCQWGQLYKVRLIVLYNEKSDPKCRSSYFHEKYFFTEGETWPAAITTRR